MNPVYRRFHISANDPEPISFLPTFHAIPLFQTDATTQERLLYHALQGVSSMLNFVKAISLRTCFLAVSSYSYFPLLGECLKKPSRHIVRNTDEAFKKIRRMHRLMSIHKEMITYSNLECRAERLPVGTSRNFQSTRTSGIVILSEFPTPSLGERVFHRKPTWLVSTSLISKPSEQNDALEDIGLIAVSNHCRANVFASFQLYSLISFFAIAPEQWSETCS